MKKLFILLMSLIMILVMSVTASARPLGEEPGIELVDATISAKDISNIPPTSVELCKTVYTNVNTAKSDYSDFGDVTDTDRLDFETNFEYADLTLIGLYELKSMENAPKSTEVIFEPLLKYFNSEVTADVFYLNEGSQSWQKVESIITEGAITAEIDDIDYRLPTLVAVVMDKDTYHSGVNPETVVDIVGKDAKGNTVTGSAYTVLLGEEYESYYPAALYNAMENQGVHEAAINKAVPDANNITMIKFMDVMLNGETQVDFPVTITFDFPGVKAGDKVIIRHLLDGEGGTYETILATTGDGTVTATFDSLSPLLFYAYDGDDSLSPVTGDGTSTYVLYIVLIASLGLALLLNKETVK